MSALEDSNRAFAAHQAYQREAEARKEDAKVVVRAREKWCRKAHSILSDVDAIAGALSSVIDDAQASSRLGAQLSADDVRIRLLHLRALLQPIGSGVASLASDIAPTATHTGGRFA